MLQPAFIGDVVLALPIAQQLRSTYGPGLQIHFLVRKGNENLLQNHPAVDQAWVWNKRQGKRKALFRLIRQIRAARFDAILNPHRFLSSGLMAGFSGAKYRIGFRKNPLALRYTHALEHRLGRKNDTDYRHEVERNLTLLQPLGIPASEGIRPKLHPAEQDYAKVATLRPEGPFVVLAPASVWFTKQWPAERWQQLAGLLSDRFAVVTVGAPGDAALCQQVADAAGANGYNLAGQLNFLQTTALMEQAVHVFSNDSAPLHFASAANVPTTAIFCSTLPEFGFGPLAGTKHVAQTPQALPCRPCGLHGKRACPEGHFKCGWNITAELVAATLGLPGNSV